jgi:hypothetical protein
MLWRRFYNACGSISPITAVPEKSRFQQPPISVPNLYISHPTVHIVVVQITSQKSMIHGPMYIALLLINKPKYFN